jgi:hypothetical protein
MPYVQTSVNREELVELHSQAIRSGKSLQRLVYEFIAEGLNKLKEDKEDGRGNQTSEEVGQGD